MKAEELEVIENQASRFTISHKKIIAYFFLVLLIFISATMVVFEVFEYRHDYRQMTTYLREEDDLNAEWGRLLIEQQTFGSTSQIGTRAVTQLRMFSPPTADTVVISLPSLEQKK
ncbi:cell division protein FtsL [Acinetobacter nectaris]|uniref:cell division protein FtsL n=1 Tax=Acinetobacter nectaris TaxID=1219382 RepID=UPI001F1896A4|nr:cell division protein FtsL [Acinetobacter nectaris]MCF8999032.1 cell division protein FtsL [Acinetobacter nectaris]MCF9027296.1 cell division protein FtsL [Acinetobacter nectaris]